MSASAQDTIFLFGDTIRVGELEWDMEKDWKARGVLISENRELYGNKVKIFLSYHANKMTEQIAFGYMDEKREFVAHGPARYYYSSGHLLGKRYYEHGQLQGLAEDYYKSRKLKMKTRYREGEMQGKYESYYENGQLEYRGFFKNGDIEGAYKSWYSNGKPRRIEHYANGLPHGSDTSYYEHGKIESIVELREGVEDGKTRVFHRNGTAWTERIYDKGRLTKVEYIKSKEGRPLEVGSFRRGNGWLNIYNEDGILIEKDKYRGGWFRKSKQVKG